MVNEEEGPDFNSLTTVYVISISKSQHILYSLLFSNFSEEFTSAQRGEGTLIQGQPRSYLMADLKLESSVSDPQFP